MAEGGGDTRAENFGADCGGNHRHLCGAVGSRLDYGRIRISSRGSAEPADQRCGSAGSQRVKPNRDISPVGFG